MIDFVAEAEALRDELIARRRDFHQHPELGFEEFRTAGIVAEVLSALDIEVQTGIAKTGVVGILEGAKDGPTILVRADMDALPIHEENATDYISTVPGKMHACGHDAHTAIGLGVAKVLAKHRDKLAGRVKFVFQPGEEGHGGAEAMIKEGVLENPRPDISLGLHVWNTSPVGSFGVVDGPVMAGASTVEITINGKGAHGALPQEGHDPVICAAQLVTALQTIVSRNVHPLDTAVLSITYIQAGTTHNVIPAQAEIQGTLRAFNLETRDYMVKRIEELSQAIAQGMNCTAEVRVGHITEPVINDAAVGDVVRGALAKILPDAPLDNDVQTMGGEDFCFFMKDIPSTFFFVGSANSERGLDYGHHHPRFDIDEDSLPLGVALMSAAVAEYLLVDEGNGV